MCYKLSIIIVTYKSDNILLCLKSFKKNIDKEIKSELIVINNYPKYFVNTKIRKILPDTKIVHNSQNLGFAKACNQGAKLAKGKYLLFLNPDTIVKKNCIEEMIKSFENQIDIGIVGCKVLNKNGSIQPSCGCFPTIFNIILDRIPLINKIIKTELIRKVNYYNKEQIPDWISGCFLLIKRNLYLKLGGFDEQYFLYGEDIDLCYRIIKAGYKIYYNPNTAIIHFDMGKSKKRKGFKAIQMRKGFLIYFSKYKPIYYQKIWKTILRIESIFKPYLYYS